MVCRDLGGKIRFSGKISTVKCFENNPLVRKTLEEDGHGRVLVVDGGGSLRCALLGDNIAEMAYKNGWDVRYDTCDFVRKQVIPTSIVNCRALSFMVASEIPRTLEKCLWVSKH